MILPVDILLLTVNIEPFELINFVKQGVTLHCNATGKLIRIVTSKELELWTCNQLSDIITDEYRNWAEWGYLKRLLHKFWWHIPGGAMRYMVVVKLS